MADKPLEDAVNRVADELHQVHKSLDRHLVTREELLQSEARIIAAIKGGGPSDEAALSALTGQLSQSAHDLSVAVVKNQP